LTGANPFDAFEAKMRSAGLPPIAIETFRHYYERLRGGESGALTEEDIDPLETLPDVEELAGYEARGASVLGKAVVIKLNGGLGTSMGMTNAKSLLGVRGGMTFLDLTVRQVLHLRRRYDCELPLLLMNSFRTRDDSYAALAPYPDLDVGLPLDFLQHKVPKVRADDLTPIEWPANPDHEWCPPGHGDIYTALLTSGMLEELLSRDLEYAFVSNSDNLGAVLDLRILGWQAEENIPFLMEATDRTEADRKGGHLARLRSGGLVLREVAQCPPDEIDRFQDVTRHRYFNTNTLWVNLRTLAGVLEERGHVLALPMIRNQKPVDPADESTPAVFQLETAMGAAISVFAGARAIRVPRERFVPVKTTNDLLALWSDVYVVTEDFRVVPAPSRAVGDLVIDLDPRYYRRIDQLRERFPKGPPSLASCRRLRVRGDIVFGGEVIVRGDVAIEHSGPGPRVVPDGEVFD
jgi:UTP--glucose-1-phosphate uridylyltransferase